MTQHVSSRGSWVRIWGSEFIGNKCEITFEIHHELYKNVVDIEASARQWFAKRLDDDGNLFGNRQYRNIIKSYRGKKSMTEDNKLI